MQLNVRKVLPWIVGIVAITFMITLMLTGIQAQVEDLIQISEFHGEAAAGTFYFLNRDERLGVVTVEDDIQELLYDDEGVGCTTDLPLFADGEFLLDIDDTCGMVDIVPLETSVLVQYEEEEDEEVKKLEVFPGP